ncbi:MAG: site-specific DNA-methyltransferase [Candidatus Wallbacteria bacterium]|nr:site-specific DNA-methyltransferase [Candidatus Wallbacteria bacterium]
MLGKGAVGGEGWALARGDCLEVLGRLPAGSVDLIATDPAYSGMNNHMKFGHGRIVGRYSDPENDKWMREFRDSPESFLEFLRLCHRALKPDRHLYVMFDSFSLLTLGHLAREVFDVKCLVTWDKVRMGMGHWYRRQHELVLFATKGKRKLAHRGFPDVWRVKRLVRSAYPTQKPRELFEIMIAASTSQGELVCDPFLGAGSAGAAAIGMGRRFIGCDVGKRAIELSKVRLDAVSRGQPDPLQPGSLVPESTARFWQR